MMHIKNDRRFRKIFVIHESQRGTHGLKKWHHIFQLSLLLYNTTYAADTPCHMGYVPFFACSILCKKSRNAWLISKFMQKKTKKQKCMFNLKIHEKMQKCIFNFKVHTEKASMKKRKHIFWIFLLLYFLCLSIFNLKIHKQIRKKAIFWKNVQIRKKGQK